jgi:hypothetical protein
MNSSQFLEKVVIVGTVSSCFGTEREILRSGVTDGARHKKETVLVIDPSKRVLSEHKRIKTAVFRLCRSYGTKLSMMNAWAVPVFFEDELTSRLDEYAVEWNAATEALVSKWPDLVEEWANKHPLDAFNIRNMAPSILEIQKMLEFGYVSFKLKTEQVKALGLDKNISGLARQAADEIATDINDSRGTGLTFTQGIKKVLERVAKKAEGLSFLHPALGTVAPGIEAVVSKLPIVGGIIGPDALLVSGLLSILTDPAKLLTDGLSIAITKQGVIPEPVQDPLPIAETVDVIKTEAVKVEVKADDVQVIDPARPKFDVPGSQIPDAPVFDVWNMFD